MPDSVLLTCRASLIRNGMPSVYSRQTRWCCAKSSSRPWTKSIPHSEQIVCRPKSRWPKSMYVCCIVFRFFVVDGLSFLLPSINRLSWSMVGETGRSTFPTGFAVDTTILSLLFTATTERLGGVSIRRRLCVVGGVWGVLGRNGDGGVRCRRSNPSFSARTSRRLR